MYEFLIGLIVSVFGGLFSFITKPVKADVVHSDKEEQEWHDMANDAWESL